MVSHFSSGHRFSEVGLCLGGPPIWNCPWKWRTVCLEKLSRAFTWTWLQASEVIVRPSARKINKLNVLVEHWSQASSWHLHKVHHSEKLFRITWSYLKERHTQLKAKRHIFFYMVGFIDPSLMFKESPQQWLLLSRLPNASNSTREFATSRPRWRPTQTRAKQSDIHRFVKDTQFASSQNNKLTITQNNMHSSRAEHTAFCISRIYVVSTWNVPFAFTIFFSLFLQVWISRLGALRLLHLLIPFLFVVFSEGRKKKLWKPLDALACQLYILLSLFSF